MEKNTKVYFYNRTIPAGGFFLTEQSQDYGRCLWELEDDMKTKPLKVKHGIALESLKV